MEHTLCSFHYGLHGTTFSYPIKDLQFWNDDLSYQCVRLNCQHFTVRVLLEDFNARPMDQECIVQDEKIIIENAQRVTLKRKLNRVNDTFFREIVLERMLHEYCMNTFLIFFLFLFFFILYKTSRNLFKKIILLFFFYFSFFKLRIFTLIFTLINYYYYY